MSISTGTARGSPIRPSASTDNVRNPGSRIVVNRYSTACGSPISPSARTASSRTAESRSLNNTDNSGSTARFDCDFPNDSTAWRRTSQSSCCKRLQEGWNRRIADGGQSGSRFLTNRFDLILKQRNERLNRVCVPYPTQRLGRVHPNDPVAAVSAVMSGRAPAHPQWQPRWLTLIPGPRDPAR